MKKLLFLLTTWLLVTFVNSQKLTEHQLHLPGHFTLEYFSVYGEKRIFYGAIPPNFNGKTIIFVPGYLNNADIFLVGNSMYKKAYNEGYKTAFISMTRGKGDWVNGEILSRAIDQVLTHYETPEATVIAHSNGGKATEAALFHYGKINKVEKVITLGTPFKGTELADIGSFPLISWALDIIGKDAGRAYSTTYYCKDIWRPYFDGITKPEQAQKFYNYGFWGYAWGKKFLFRGALKISGAAIEIFGGGANDGVSPYYSTTKPGAREMLSKNSIYGELNHLDIAHAEYIWGLIQPALKDNNRSNTNTNITKTKSSKSAIHTQSSNTQILSDAGSLTSFIQENTNEISINLISENPEAHYYLSNPLSRSFIQLEDNSIENAHNKKFIIPVKKGRSLAQKEFKINTDSANRYLAFVNQEEENPMIYQYVPGDNPKLIVSFPKLKNNQLDKITVKAEISNIQNEKSTKGIIFTRKNNLFIFETSSLEKGIYSMLLTGKIDHVYQRNLISGFVVGNDIPALIEESVEEEKLENNMPNNGTVNAKNNSINIYPIPAKDVLHISSPFDKLNYTLYNIDGKTIQKGTLNNKAATLNLSAINPGIYIISIEGENVSYSKKIIIK